jgi:hypothetical protein
MSENEDQSPFGRGFVAACIVIGAILACGGVLLATGLSSDAPTATPTTTNSTSPSTDDSTSRSTNGTSADAPSTDCPSTNGSVADAPATDCPSTDCPSADGSVDGATRDGSSTGDSTSSTPTPGQPGAGSHVGQSAGEAVAQPTGRSSAGVQPTGTANRCVLPDGDQSIPSNQAPTSDGWEVSRRVVVPRSSAYGPAKTDPDGFRRCFSHSPTGAVYAAYNVIAALADQTRAVPTAGKLMVPGRDADALIQQLKQEPADGASEPTQLAGYRVLDASRDRATIMLALPMESEYMSATITLTWYDGDWRLVPPTNNNPVGAPYSQHRDLDGFVAWSGV